MSELSQLAMAIDSLASKTIMFNGMLPRYEITDEYEKESWSWDPDNGLRHGRSKNTTLKFLLKKGTSPYTENINIKELILKRRLLYGGMGFCSRNLLTQVLEEDLDQSLFYGSLVNRIMPYREKLNHCKILTDYVEKNVKSSYSRERLINMLEMWRDYRVENISFNQLINIYIADFYTIPIEDPKTLNIDSIFFEKFDALKNEASIFLRNVKAATHYAVDINDDDTEKTVGDNPKGWRSLSIVENYCYYKNNESSYPVACSIVKEVQKKFTVISASYLILEKHTEISVHADGLNHALSYHMGITIPDGCMIKVLDETINLQENHSFLFNDSYLHSVANHSDSTRIVFNIVVLNPEFSVEEQKALQDITLHIPKYVLSYPG